MGEVGKGFLERLETFLMTFNSDQHRVLHLEVSHQEHSKARVVTTSVVNHDTVFEAQVYFQERLEICGAEAVKPLLSRRWETPRVRLQSLPFHARREIVDLSR